MKCFNKNLFGFTFTPKFGVTLRGKAGFTLIELLVIISIIGFLTALALTALQEARIKARDARRKADLTMIRKALDLYFDKYNYYPPAVTGGCPSGYDCSAWISSTVGGNWIPGLEEFLPKMPVDPVNNLTLPWVDDHFSYAYGNVGRYSYKPTYDLVAQLESNADPDRCAAKCYKWSFLDGSQWCTACGGSYSDQIYDVSQLKGF